MTDLRALQSRWDAEAATIERGTRAFFPDKPAGEPNMLTGTLAVLAIFLALGMMWSLLP